MSTEPTKPADFVFEDVDVGPAEAVVHNARTRATQLTKGAVKHYLQQYFDEKGRYRNQIEALCPYVVQYETGITGTAKDADSSVYELQIARYWSNLRMRLPCLIIMDTSYEMNSTGLGGVVEAYDFGDYQGIGLRMDATIGVTIEIAASDEAAATDLRDVLSLIFGPLTHLNRSHVLIPADGGSWEARLPLRIDAQGVDRRQIPVGNNLDVFWTTTLVLNVAFEGVAIMAMDHPKHVAEHAVDIHVDPCFENAESVAPSVSLGIQVPETVYLGHQTRIHATYVPFGSRFQSDTPSILMVHGETMFPRKMGSCKILLLDSLGKLIQAYPVTVTSA